MKAKKKQEPKSNTKKVWLISGIIASVVVIAVIITVIVLYNSSNKLSTAYNKCSEEFAAIEAETEKMKENIEIVLYLKPRTSKETLESMTRTINSLSEVKSVLVSTSDEEIENFISNNATNDEITKLLTNDEELKEIMLGTMPAVIRVKIRDINGISSIKYIVENDPEFRENIDDDHKPVYNDSSIVNLGTLDLLDDGKTIIIEAVNDAKMDKINCVYSELNMPHRIRDAIEQAQTTGETRRDNWGNLNIEWSYNSKKKLHAVIYQK